MPAPTPPPLRSDLFVTTALTQTPALHKRAQQLARELSAPTVMRRKKGLTELFADLPHTERALVVQADGRLNLAARTGANFFYHPNMAYLRLRNFERGDPDSLFGAGQFQAGERVLDATLGFASEAILCAHAVGDAGQVDGIESVPELGIVVREGLQNVQTASETVNQAMRRVHVVHLGHHLPFLVSCTTGAYDVVCFDPFFDDILKNSETFEPLRAFGDHAKLLPEALHEARRIATRRVLVKASRYTNQLEEWGASDIYSARAGKVVYGLFDPMP